jgi:hypothetical protein
MAEDKLEEVSKKLGIIIALLAEERIKELSGDEQIGFLDRLGVDRDIIADLRGITPKSVGEALSRLKAKSKS